MTTRFFAKAASFTDDGYSTLLALADDPDHPTQYLTLNMTNVPDEQDVALGMTGIHIDAGPLLIDGYDLVEGVEAAAGNIKIRLKRSVANEAKIDQNIYIGVDHQTINGTSVNEVIRRFATRLLRDSGDTEFRGHNT